MEKIPFQSIGTPTTPLGLSIHDAHDGSEAGPQRSETAARDSLQYEDVGLYDDEGQAEAGWPRDEGSSTAINKVLDHQTKHPQARLGYRGLRDHPRAAATTLGLRKYWIAYKTPWLPEMASFGFAAIVLAAIALLLAMGKDKQQPDWPSMLNVNTLLSILITIFKTALLFPVAEGIGELKSPWGSLKLIVKNSGNLLACLGAGAILLSVAMDPFAQQVLEFYSCQQPVEGMSASIPRTNNYTTQLFNNKAVTVAFYKGLLGPPSTASSALSISCPSKNCIFGDPSAELVYSSLAVCSSVVDISSSVSGSADWTGWSKWDFSLPTGLTLTSNARRSDDSNSTYPSVLAAAKTEVSGSLHARVQLIMMSLDCRNASHPTKNNCSPGVLAFNITLTPCVQTFSNISYVNSEFREDRLSSTLFPMRGTWETLTLAGDYPSAPGIDCSDTLSPGGRKTLPTNLHAQSGLRYLFEPSDANRTKHLNITYYDPACVYQYAFWDWAILWGWLEKFFGTQEQPFWLQPMNTTDQGIYFGIMGGEEWLKTIWRNGTANLTTVTAFAEGLTNSLTAAIRQNGAPGYSEPIVGTAFEARTCIGVNWPWLRYPAAILLMTLVFMVLIIAKSHEYTRISGMQDGRGRWKSSVLPYLWCDVPESMKLRARGLNYVEEMVDHSESLIVALDREEAQGKGSRVYGEEGRWVLREF
ncbi:hypothetical protein QBC34DRAFT_427750 [Podospora aff. communis PSN243]|uniref:Uncharacterized protein n=1 Tax=Podospora aff. communis PSN243 TaxID=3040156 RepID=A0AAV9GGW5_9PEZI|nr:hypothetical protein QBC34DRAFT_427750 [Podospora aff. communis PSN243]